MKMKKLFCTLFAAVGLALVGCGKSNGVALKTAKQTIIDFCVLAFSEDPEDPITPVEDDDYFDAAQITGLDEGTSWYTGINFGTNYAQEGFLVPVINAVVAFLPEYVNVDEAQLAPVKMSTTVAIAMYETTDKAVSVTIQSTINQGSMFAFVIATPWMDPAA